jgi:hypothetical protein
MVAKIETSGDPKSMREARRRADWPEWHEAAKREYKSLIDNDTWDLVELPEGETLFEGIWVFVTKRDEHGNEVKKKARWVVNGSRQRKDLGHFDKTASPTLKFASLRTLLAKAAKRRWPVYQLDFDSAYLNGDLDEDIYVRQPEGFEVPGKEHLVCKLKKSVYGLKQAGRQWNEKINAELELMGFYRCHADSCVYIKILVTEVGDVEIGIYVDDSMLTGEPPEEVAAVKEMLMRKFKMKDLGEARHLLSLLINQSPDRRFMEISQRQFALVVLKRFGYENCKGVTTPMNPDFPTRAAFESQFATEHEMKQYPYLQALGSLMYLMVGTRPDLAFSLSVLSQYSTKYTKFHWDAIVRVFRYLQYSKDLVLRYDGDNLDEPLYGFSDSDWAGDKETRRSTSGYTFLMAGAAVVWKSRRQPTVSGSTVEAEYLAVGEATKEALWLRTLYSELGIIDPSFPTRILCDNQGTISLANNPLLSDHTKHIDIRHHFVKEKIRNQEIYLSYCPTSDMVADILTKALNRIKHWRFVHGLGLRGNSIPVGEI